MDWLTTDSKNGEGYIDKKVIELIKQEIKMHLLCNERLTMDPVYDVLPETSHRGRSPTARRTRTVNKAPKSPRQPPSAILMSVRPPHLRIAAASSNPRCLGLSSNIF